MDFSDYQVLSYKNIQPHMDDKDEILNWSMGLAEEVGESFNLIKHKYWGNEEFDKEKLAKELGDVLWYLSALCTAFNINLDTVARLNYEKLNYRFVEDFTEEQSKDRHNSDKKFNETELYKDIIKNINLM